jgi:chemotaxis protein CheX
VTDVESDITQIAYSIWETLFSAPLDRAPAGSLLRDDTPLMTGCIQIDGAWNGAVMLQCPQALAERLSAELFQPDGAITPDEVHDTIGELTNMLAGNVKALLPEPSRISLPAVAQGADYDLRVMGTRVEAAVAFTCLEQLLVVTLLRSTADGDA